MKHTPLRIALTSLALLALTTASAVAANVGPSAAIGDPNFYGRLNLSRYPTPQVINARPVLVHDNGYRQDPLYLRVPPGQNEDWGRYCHEYNACEREVYFVRDDWYTHEYAPRYQQQHQYRQDDPREVRREEVQNDRRNDRRGDHGSDYDRGR